MGFDDQLRSYLEKVDQQAPADRRPVQRRVDEHALRAHFLQRLREHQSKAAFVKWVFDQWSPKLGRFARYIEKLPPQGAPVGAGEALAFACRALDVATHLSGDVMALVDQMEMRRVLNGFERGDEAIETYALENGLVRDGGPGRLRLSGFARVFLRLRGKDAVRWLLTIEVTLSRGPQDPWSVPRQLLQEAISTSGIQRKFWEDEEYSPYATQTLNRLDSIGVLSALVDHDGQIYCYAAVDSMRDVIQAVVEDGPWHMAVAALMEDERAAVLRLGPSASDATIEQSRMVAHEIRNALIPVRHHIDALSSGIAEAPQRGRLEAARRGVVRVLSFVDELVEISDLVDEPVTLFEAADAVREALGWLDGSERVEFVSEGRVRVRAPRLRLARAISNLALNALQATSESQRVRVTTRQYRGFVEIVVDDAGPGVPAELQARVFDDGFTTRPGGSGFGLAFVRSVVERVGGKVRYEASDLGGARLVIAMDEASES